MRRSGFGFSGKTVAQQRVTGGSADSQQPANLRQSLGDIGIDPLPNQNQGQGAARIKNVERPSERE